MPCLLLLWLRPLLPFPISRSNTPWPNEDFMLLWHKWSTPRPTYYPTGLRGGIFWGLESQKEKYMLQADLNTVGTSNRP